jgi:alpha-L-arabinofuranosidase
LWQQIPIRAGVATALGLNVFHRQAAKLVMCNIAQMVNVLDSMLLTSEDKCVRTPSYYAFELAKPHRGKTSVKTEPADDDPLGVSVSVSVEGNSLALTLVNPKHEQGVKLRCSVAGKTIASAAARSLYHADFNACNTFESPDTIVPKSVPAAAQGSEIAIELPPLSVTTIEAKLG